MKMLPLYLNKKKKNKVRNKQKQLPWYPFVCGENEESLLIIVSALTTKPPIPSIAQKQEMVELSK